MAGPYVYPNPKSLIGQDYVADVAGNNLGECVSLVKYYVTALQNKKTATWIEGPNVIETLKNGGSIMEGTAIATFRNGHFESGHGHAALYAGFVRYRLGFRIIVVEQFLGATPSGRIITRELHNLGKHADGSYVRPSNNGEAFSIIL